MFGLQFHWYGFLIGLGVLAGLSVTESLLKKKQVPLEIFWRVMGVVGVGAVVGARVWHVATDAHLYVGQWVQAMAIWEA